MIDRYDEERVEHRGVGEIHDVVVDGPAERNAGVMRIQEALYLLFGIIEVLIGIRFVLRAFAANPAAPFAAAIYGVTGPLVAPFNGIFGTPRLNQSVFEPQSIVAIVVYAVIGWILAKLVWLIMVDTGNRSVMAEHVERTETEREHDVAA